MNKILLLAVICTTYIAAFSQTIIGTTTYDVQTNNASKNRIIAYDDGTVSALWTGSTDILGLGWADRGMFYNHFDGSSWAPDPTMRVEDVRTGFGEMLNVEDHEVVISHSIVGTDTSIILFKNDAVGSTTWTECGGSGQIKGLWPLTYCPDGTDDIYVITATNFSFGLPQAIAFSRSDDGGETWTVMSSILPYLTFADGFPSIGGAADSYLVRVHGSDVYVLFGITTSDLVLLHSNDYGNEGTWESTKIIDFPFDNYAGGVQTDIDGDFITDTIDTNDGYFDMLIQDDGTVHVFSGYLRCYSDGFGNIFNFNSSGIWHWSTGMTGAELINTEVDWVRDDCTIYAPYAGIGADDFIYRFPGLSTNPAAAWDPSTGRLYCLFTMALEYTDIYDDPLNFAAESFRDVFGMYSDDGGATWSIANNLTNSAESGVEHFFLYAADKVVDGKVHALWQQDNDPGTALEGDPIHTSDMVYQAFSDADFIAPSATPAYDYTIDMFYVTFTDASSGATCYSWDFGDGGTSTLASPAHTYAGGGTYTVCLTVSNSYGSETYCEDIVLVTAPAADFSFTGDPTVDFTDLSANAPTSWSWDFDDGATSTEQNPSHLFADNGLYNVCLTATNLGGSSTSCQNVGINFAVQAPVVDFAYTAVGTTVSFNDMSTNVPTSWTWDFADGSTSTVASPTHIYGTSGTYHVCLTAGNAGGIGTTCKDVSVVTGIFDNADNFLTLYPNPASDFISINSDMDLTDMICELYTVSGQKAEVSVQHISATQLSIDVKHLAAGNYTLKITNANGSESRVITIE